jgi:predicted HAD superfamily Cof-like phosphohydrolase
MVDLMYFANGVLYKMGLTAAQIDACCSAVHHANMDKKRGSNAKRAVEGAADAVKPLGWVSPEERIGNILEA